MNVPGCLQESKLEKSISVQTFVDASNEAYGAVSYLRSEYAQGCYGARIIASKTRVGPLTPMSTPRVDLVAPILGLHLTLSDPCCLQYSNCSSSILVRQYKCPVLDPWQRQAVPPIRCK